MTTRYLKALSAGFLTFLAVSVAAHDPSEHAGSAQMPDCSAMSSSGDINMEMDANDPVAQAMMKKCMSAMHNDNSTVDKDASTGMSGHEASDTQNTEHTNSEGGDEHGHGD